mmetsp:Transcript_340/g.1126  ORF Transcript_340/g.1126 Transcript_340/m.1126 type:complete len:132 (+) Transcript_340:47-442(+)
MTAVAVASIAARVPCATFSRARSSRAALRKATSVNRRAVVVCSEKKNVGDKVEELGALWNKVSKELDLGAADDEYMEKIKDMKTADESARVRGEDFEVVEGFEINWGSTLFVLLGLGGVGVLVKFVLDNFS